MGLADYEKCDHLVLSLGGGVQSSAIAIMAYDEKDYGIPKPDQIIFSDTKREPDFVYNWMDTLSDWIEDRGGEIEIVEFGDLMGDIKEKIKNGESFAPIPAYSEGDGAPLRRQCTRQYKIKPVENQIRKKLGYEKGQVMKGKVDVGMMLGISTDEIERANQNNRTSWTHNLFPLLDIGFSRQDCARIYDEVDIDGRPIKSSCTFCPYHDDDYWKFLKEEHPDEFEEAVQMDKLVRDMSMKGVENKLYLHRSGVPLEDVDFTEDDNQGEMFDNQSEQRSCGAFCDV